MYNVLPILYNNYYTNIKIIIKKATTANSRVSIGLAMRYQPLLRLLAMENLAELTRPKAEKLLAKPMKYWVLQCTFT